MDYTDIRINGQYRRNDNGRIVTIVSARPTGLRVFYLTEDRQDGHTTLIDGRDLRPLGKDTPQ